MLTAIGSRSQRLYRYILTRFLHRCTMHDINMNHSHIHTHDHMLHSKATHHIPSIKNFSMLLDKLGSGREIVSVTGPGTIRMWATSALVNALLLLTCIADWLAKPFYKNPIESGAINVSSAKRSHQPALHLPPCSVRAAGGVGMNGLWTQSKPGRLRQHCHWKGGPRER